MGTISDKLIRIINTKEDIRQALISKGYDVPTSIPFKEYAKMILDLPCNADSFPDIEGIVARYSASGITNEQMAANPVWVDKTGNGRDLQLKNFSWKGMSGVGGYVGDFSKWVNNRDTTEIGITKSNSKVIIDVKVSQGSGKNIVFISKSNLGISNNVTIKITSTYPEGVMKFANSASNKYLKLPSNGIITLQDNPEYTSNEMHLHLASADLGQITIEQLPLYPGALVFDGVDDYGTCDNFPVLTKEKGYTVVALRQWITRGEIAQGLVSNVKNWLKDGAFLLEYRNIQADHLNKPISFGAIGSEMDLPHILTYQTSKSYNGVSITTGNFEGTDVLHVGKLAPTNVGTCINAAIWELVFLDHDATEEELTKIKDYFVKTYPWLFPDQAWTVTGKTNEDEDRATIANITGNGNDLVLSNFGFAKGSGYGLYNAAFSSKSNLQYWSKQKIQFSKSQIETNKVLPYLIMECKDELSYNIKIKMTGFDSGVKLKWGFTDGYTYIEGDGIHVLNKKSTTIRHLHIEYSEDFDPDHVVTIEQIPEYEGYLITDGVDDIASSNTVVYEADFTFIGEWKFIQKDDTVAGINSVSHLYIQNRYNRGATVMINSTFENKKNITDYMTFKAITSKGKGYDENWNEVDLLYGDGNKGPSQVSIGGQGGSDFCHMIFKNMALYMNKVFTKDECIKAYNYLQTLKSK
ncbi:hypothetical protein [uncultured Dialister sp.]|jgi:hypothetical protein|uniref:hypothetical protein n=1 Tax=uncultured Dialister sp. TaxID=278064 RepID=UPI0025979658|nr:hypothetical protein [uncultured Dialister sp.]